MDIMKMGNNNPNYLSSCDLCDLPKSEITLTIANFREEEVVSGAGNGKEIATVMHFQENGFKPMIINATNKKRIVKLYKTRETDNLIGKRVIITVEQVRAFGDTHDALRIKKELPKSQYNKKPAAQVIPCEICDNPIQPFGNKTAEYMAGYTKNKYGKCLCGSCAKSAAEEAEKAEQEKAKAEQAEQTETEVVNNEQSAEGRVHEKIPPTEKG